MNDPSYANFTDSQGVYIQNPAPASMLYASSPPLEPVFLPYSPFALDVIARCVIGCVVCAFGAWWCGS
jgi:hypothetical protein